MVSLEVKRNFSGVLRIHDLRMKLIQHMKFQWSQLRVYKNITLYGSFKKSMLKWDLGYVYSIWLHPKMNIGYKWGGNFGLPIAPEESIQIPIKNSSPYMATKNDTIFDTRFLGTKKYKLQKKLFNIKIFFYWVWLVFNIGWLKCNCL